MTISPGRPFGSSHISEQDLRRALMFRSHQVPMAEIALILGRSSGTLSVVLTRIKQGQRPVRSIWIDSAEATETMIDMVSHGLLLTDIAHFYGISVAAVSARFAKAGFDREARVEWETVSPAAQ